MRKSGFSNLRVIKIQVIAFGIYNRYLWVDGARYATKPNKEIAIKWVRNIRAIQRYTVPWSALTNTIKDKEAAQIILISDGSPSTYLGQCTTKNGQKQFYSQDACITDLNQTSRIGTEIGPVQIDTISIGGNACKNTVSFRSWMGRLASGNNGKCTLIN